MDANFWHLSASSRHEVFTCLGKPGLPVAYLIKRTGPSRCKLLAKMSDHIPVPAMGGDHHLPHRLAISALNNTPFLLHNLRAVHGASGIEKV